MFAYIFLESLTMKILVKRNVKDLEHSNEWEGTAKMLQGV